MNNNVIHYDLITDNLGNTLCIDNKIYYYYVPDDYVKIIRNLEQQVKTQKEVIDMFLNKVDKNKMLLNNPDLLDLYLKIKGVSK